MPDVISPQDGMVAVLDTFLACMGERASPAALDRLRPGTAVRLQASGRSGESARIEVWTADGLPLGYLPRDDALALQAVAGGAVPAAAQVTAIIPAHWRPRVALRVAVSPDRGA